jgi:hypothetical protein
MPDINELTSICVKTRAEADRAFKTYTEAKAAAELLEARSNTAKGALKAVLEKSKVPLPITIELENDRLLTVYQDSYGIDFIVTDKPATPQ